MKSIENKKTLKEKIIEKVLEHRLLLFIGIILLVIAIGTLGVFYGILPPIPTGYP